MIGCSAAKMFLDALAYRKEYNVDSLDLTALDRQPGRA
jgi:hypothetical protein